jgi:beta-glucanase (GH16 family)
MRSPIAVNPLFLAVAFAVLRLAAVEPAEPRGADGTGLDRMQPGAAEAAARYTRSDWVLIWQDEFSGGPAPAADKWNFERGLVRNHELQYYTANRRENARVADGQLIITGRHEPWEGASYTSASLTTRGKFAFTYGKVEIRAKIPTGRGTWPALWMLGADEDKVGWPLCGEIDLMENVGFDPRKLHFSVHTGAFNHAIHTQRSRAVVLDAPWADFHRYGLIWTPERLEFFLDGEKTFEFANDSRGVAHWPFDAPQFLIVNLALGGEWGGQQGMDDGIFPVEFRVDYVRVWQQPKP